MQRVEFHGDVMALVNTNVDVNRIQFGFWSLLLSGTETFLMIHDR